MSTNWQKMSSYLAFSDHSALPPFARAAVGLTSALSLFFLALNRRLRTVQLSRLWLNAQKTTALHQVRMQCRFLHKRQKGDFRITAECSRVSRTFWHSFTVKMVSTYQDADAPLNRVRVEPLTQPWTLFKEGNAKQRWHAKVLLSDFFLTIPIISAETLVKACDNDMSNVPGYKVRKATASNSSTPRWQKCI